MRITKRTLRRIIQEQWIRILPEGYTVPRFETTEDMNLFMDELEVDEEVEQDVIDPLSGELWIAAGESIQDQEWYEDSDRYEAPEEVPFDPTDMDDPRYDWEEHDRLEREEEEEVERLRQEEEAKYEATKEKIMNDAADGGEDWAMDTMHDAYGNPNMWSGSGSMGAYGQQFDSPAEYVRAYGQDAAMDIASGYTEWADDEDARELWDTLSDKDPYNTSWWQDSGKPSKTLFKEIVADAVYGGIERGVQKYVEREGEWIGKEEPMVAAR